MPMSNYVIGVSNYVIATRSTLSNSVIVHTGGAQNPVAAIPGHGVLRWQFFYGNSAPQEFYGP